MIASSSIKIYDHILKSVMSNGTEFFKRIDCWKDTKERAKNYPTPISEKISNSPIIQSCDGTKHTEILVQNMDSIDCGLYWKSKGFNPVVLNLADDCFPGGCVDLGSGAQEESLYRRTNLCETLNLSMYPIKNHQLIYSNNVSIFKTSEQDGWKIIDPIPMSFITCPGIRNPHLNWPDLDCKLADARFKDKDVTILSEKIRNILRIALAKGHDIPILGAMGCGAWKNPNKHVAEIFKNVLEEQEFKCVFQYITLAIKKFNGHNQYITIHRDKFEDNYDVFAHYFLCS